MNRYGTDKTDELIEQYGMIEGKSENGSCTINTTLENEGKILKTVIGYTDKKETLVDYISLHGDKENGHKNPKLNDFQKELINKLTEDNHDEVKVDKGLGYFKEVQISTDLTSHETSVRYPITNEGNKKIHPIIIANQLLAQGGIAPDMEHALETHAYSNESVLDLLEAFREAA